MRVLASETPDKKTQTIYTIAPERLAELIREDHSFHEIIPMIDNTVTVRLFFDVEMVDVSDSITVLDTALTALNSFFGTIDDDWAIANGSRGTKASFHILSRRYAARLVDLQQYVERMACPVFDATVYTFPIWNHNDEGSFRLPNQSKGGINKEGPPLMVVQGELHEFFVTQTAGLEYWNPSVATMAVTDTSSSSR